MVGLYGNSPHPNAFGSLPHGVIYRLVSLICCHGFAIDAQIDIYLLFLFVELFPVLLPSMMMCQHFTTITLQIALLTEIYYLPFLQLF